MALRALPLLYLLLSLKTYFSASFAPSRYISKGQYTQSGVPAKYSSIGNKASGMIYRSHCNLFILIEKRSVLVVPFHGPLSQLLCFDKFRKCEDITAPLKIRRPRYCQYLAPSDKASPGQSNQSADGEVSRSSDRLKPTILSENLRGQTAAKRQ